jgi:hypothetical protein
MFKKISTFLLKFKIFKLHVDLYRYLKTELKKKRTNKELLKFTLDIAASYFKELFKLAKEPFNLLDPTYRKQKQDLDNHKKAMEELKKSFVLLHKIDQNLEKLGFPNYKKKQFRRDYFVHGIINSEILNELEKGLK